MAHLLKNSHAHPSHHAVHLKKTHHAEEARVMVSIRRRVGHDRLPTFAEYVGCPPRTRLSVEEFAERYGSHQDDHEQVKVFLISHGLKIVDEHRARRHVTAVGNIGQMNTAFDINIQDYEKDDKHHGRYKFRCHDQMTIPDHLAPLVVTIHGLATEARITPIAIPGVPANAQTLPNGALTPQQAMAIYNTPTNLATGQNIGIIGTAQNANDIALTMSAWGIPNPNITLIFLPGAVEPSDPTEGNLDSAMCGSFGQGANLYVYFANTSSSTAWSDVIGRMIHPNPGDPILDITSFSVIFNHNIELKNPAFVLATDALYEDSALQGITMFAGSGDEGASDYETTGTVSIGSPVDSPWVTAIGGTALGTASGPTSTISPTNFVEWVWNDQDGSPDATGGGVSVLFAKPSYQNNANIPLPIGSTFVGRGMPDISGNASPYTNFNIFINGTSRPVGGTSSSTPQYAGIFARINAALGRNVGFINPTLYAAGSGTYLNAFAIAADGQSFADPAGNVWSLKQSATQGLQIFKNNVLEANTANVVYFTLYLPTNTYYQGISSGSWFSKVGPNGGYTATDNPFPGLLAIRDIDGTTGGSQNNGGNGVTGYPVKTGWDACTGLGVVNGTSFLNFLKSINGPIGSQSYFLEIQPINAIGAGPTALVGPIIVLSPV